MNCQVVPTANACAAARQLVSPSADPGDLNAVLSSSAVTHSAAVQAIRRPVRKDSRHGVIQQRTGTVNEGAPQTSAHHALVVRSPHAPMACLRRPESFGLRCAVGPDTRLC